jgi:hypothetical protein
MPTDRDGLQSDQSPGVADLWELDEEDVGVGLTILGIHGLAPERNQWGGGIKQGRKEEEKRRRDETDSSTGPYVPKRLARSSPHPSAGTLRTTRYLRGRRTKQLDHAEKKEKEIGRVRDGWWVQVVTWTRRRRCRRARPAARRGRVASLPPRRWPERRPGVFVSACLRIDCVRICCHENRRRRDRGSAEAAGRGSAERQPCRPGAQRRRRPRRPGSGAGGFCGHECSGNRFGEESNYLKCSEGQKLALLQHRNPIQMLTSSRIWFHNTNEATVNLTFFSVIHQKWHHVVKGGEITNHLWNRGCEHVNKAKHHKMCSCY